MKRILSTLIILCMLTGLVPAAAFARTETLQSADRISAARLPDNYVSFYDGVDLNLLLEGDEEQEEKLRENAGVPTYDYCIKQLREGKPIVPQSREVDIPDPTPPENSTAWNKLEKGLKYNEYDFHMMQTFLEQTADNGKKNGLQLNSAYDKEDPTTWAGTFWEKCEGDVYYLSEVIFNSTILQGSYMYSVPSGDFCLGGALDLHGLSRLYAAWSYGHKYSYADYSDCPFLITIWNKFDTYNNDVRLHGCKSLMSLGLDYSDITEVDLSTLTTLWVLSLSGNAISYLDFTDCCRTLGNIDLDDCQFTELDVSMLSNLYELDVKNNYLTELDLTHNPELGILWCDGNKIGSLDVSKNTNLGHISAKGCDMRTINLPKGGNVGRSFAVGDNKLTELDLTGITGLTAFNCDNNYIKELDFTDCPYLISFVARNNLLEKITFGSNPCFESIMVPNNCLTELVIPKEATMFNRLFCENNYITELDLAGFTFLYEFDCHNNNIKRLTLSEQSGTAPDEAPCSFHILDCSGNPIEELIDVPFAKTKTEDGRFDLHSEGGGYAVIRSELTQNVNGSNKVYKIYASAEAAPECTFEGWYAGERKVSADREILITTIKGFYTSSVQSDFEYTELTAKFTGQKPQSFNVPHETAPDEHVPTQNLITEGCAFNENDVKIVREFLEQTDESGKKNGEKLMSSYDSEKPESWTCCFWVERECEAHLEALFLDNQLDNDTGKYILPEDRYTLSGTFNMSGAEHLGYVYLTNSEYESMDFSGCTALTHLFLNDNTHLSGINIKGCDALEVLDVRNCRFEQIDISGHDMLRYINAANNSLTEIKLSDVPNLTFLNCANNAITELDTEKVPHLNLLRCEDNRIKELDVHMCTDIGELNCARNGMTSLKIIEGEERLGNYAHMHILHCEDNELSFIYVVPTILICHAENNKISTVNRFNSVTDGNLMYIYISHNNLQNLALDNEYYICFVDCSYNELENFGIIGYNQLITLDCSHNKLTKNSLPTGLMENRVICYDCSDNNISEIDLWRCGRNMYYLNISDNPVTYIKNAPLGYILRQPIMLGDPMFYRIDIKVQGTGCIDYDLDTITAVGENFKGIYVDGKMQTAQNTLSTDGMQSCTVALRFSDFLLGDVHGNGEVNTADAVYILKYSAEMLTLAEEQKEFADTNSDGAVNTADAVMILKYAAGAIAEF